MEQMKMSEEERKEVSAFLRLRRSVKFGSVSVTIKDGRVQAFVTEKRDNLSDLVETMTV